MVLSILVQVCDIGYKSFGGLQKEFRLLPLLVEPDDLHKQSPAQARLGNE